MSFSSVIVEYPRFIKSLRESFALAVDEDNYKHGAFRGLITASTPPIQAIDVFLASEKVTEHEKANSFRPLREILAQLHGADLSKMSMMKFFGDVMPAMEFMGVFMDWKRTSGMYVPGTMVQILDKNDKVIETQMIANDGMVTTTQGGAWGVDPDAPPSFKRPMYAVEFGPDGVKSYKKTTTNNSQDSADGDGGWKQRRNRAKKAKKADKKAGEEKKNTSAMTDQEGLKVQGLGNGVNERPVGTTQDGSMSAGDGRSRDKDGLATKIEGSYKSTT